MNRIQLIFNIIEKYMTERQQKYPVWTEHDILGFNVDYKKISKEDLEALKLLDVIFGGDYDGLYIFT